jgi:predicted negative regulator of RcsB-dependent stress response
MKKIRFIIFGLLIAVVVLFSWQHYNKRIQMHTPQRATLVYNMIDLNSIKTRDLYENN